MSSWRGNHSFFRDNKVKDGEIQFLKKKMMLYKKRWIREKAKSQHTNSPRTHTRALLRNFSVKSVRKTLFRYNVLIKQLREKYNSETKKGKIRLVKNISGSILKKYKVKMETFRSIGIGVSRKKKGERNCLTKRIYEKVKAFYLRQDNSRVITGLKKTVTKGKKKKQRRILCDDLINLHQKFLIEGKTKISYTLFCRLRPFWVLFPTDADRDTCMCKTCDNIDLMVTGLYKAGVISLDKADNILKECVCDNRNFKCMYGECDKCKHKTFKTNKSALNRETTWYEWITKSEKRTLQTENESREKVVKYTVKELMTGQGETLLKKFSNAIEKFKKHRFNCWAQYGYFIKRRETLKKDECIVHVDFSENYVGKMTQEIQSMHFGASRKQITLHTGVLYVGGNKRETFCTVSDSLNHSPSAIWSHMKQILMDVRKQNPQVTSVEFFSDGPTTQYKQKGNFFLLSTEPFEMGFESVKWSFFESGHGKGISDGVGGSIKREADRKVKHGQDIMSAEQFVKHVNTSKTKVSLITENEIKDQTKRLEETKLRPVTGTLRLHQIIVNSPGIVSYRNLSCTCNHGNCQFCNENLKHANLLEDQNIKHVNSHKRKMKTIEIGPTTKKMNITKCSEKSDHVEESRRNQTHNQDSNVVDSHLGKTQNCEDKNTCTLEKRLPVQTEERKQIFKEYLKQLSACKNFPELKRKCQSIPLDNYSFDPVSISMCSHDELQADFDAVDYMPDDIPTESELCPCIVNADGNCLPSCGSVLAFGETDHVEEIRVRIVAELVRNENKYLDDTVLIDGIEHKKNSKKTRISLNYAQYSESYIPGTKLNKRQIQSLYRKEVLSITKDRSFMGVWQIHALSTILKAPIYSVYPKLGNQSVRKDLNRRMNPVSDHTNDPVYILWSSNREDMTKEHWIPNHFVPLLPILIDDTIKDTPPQNTTFETSNEEISIPMVDEHGKNGIESHSKQHHLNKFELNADVCEKEITNVDVETVAIKPDYYDMKLDENENCVTMYIHKNADGGYDIEHNDGNTKHSQESIRKHSTENNCYTVRVSVGQVTDATVPTDGTSETVIQGAPNETVPIESLDKNAPIERTKKTVRKNITNKTLPVKQTHETINMDETNIDGTSETIIEESTNQTASLQSTHETVLNTNETDPIESTNEPVLMEITNQTYPIESANETVLNTMKTDPIESTNETTLMEITNQTDQMESTNETTLREITNQTDVMESTNETTLMEITNQTDPMESTNETTLREITNQTDPMESTNETTLMEITNQTDLSESTNETTLREITNKTDRIESTKEKVLMEITNQTDLIESTKEKVLIEITNQTNLIECTKENVLMDITNKTDPIESTKEKVLMEITNQTDLIENTKEKVLMEIKNKTDPMESTKETTLMEITNKTDLTESRNKKVLNTNRTDLIESTNETVMKEIKNKTDPIERTTNETVLMEITNKTVLIECTNETIPTEVINLSAPIENINNTVSNEIDPMNVPNELPPTDGFHETSKTQCDNDKIKPIDISNPRMYIGKYVIILFNKRPYPGIIVDASGAKILVSCMKQTGRKNANIFTWPRVNKDQDWYTIDRVIGIIPDPKHVKGVHFKINERIWDNLIKCMNY